MGGGEVAVVVVEEVAEVAVVVVAMVARHLPLWVDHQRPPPRHRGDDAIVDREGVGGEPLDVPLPNLDGVAHDLLEVELLGRPVEGGRPSE